MSSFDVAVIGAGPGGYIAAIRAAQLGFKTAIVEKEPQLGGTCLRVGCIPSKALLQSSENYYEVKHHFAEHGIIANNVELDLPTMLRRKDEIVDELTSGVGMLMKKNKVTVFKGHGSLAGTTTVKVKDGDNEETFEATNIILATGSEAVELPHVKFDGETVVSSTEALAFANVPEHLIVIGAGAVGLEMGSVWCRLGAKVTVVELFDRITPFADKRMSSILLKALKEQGLEFRLGHKMTGVEKKDGKAHVTLVNSKDESEEILVGDHVLVSVGRRPYSGGLGLENAGLSTDERGRVPVDGNLRTAVPTIYAIGDLIEGPMLAHKAEHDGVAAAEAIAGMRAHLDHNTVPNVVYTEPELAQVGLTEEKAKEEGYKVKAGRFPFRNNGRAKSRGAKVGEVKIVADAATDRVLGIHIVGPSASELIAEAVIAMEYKASSEDIARTSHAHPTLSEVMKEAALAVDRRALNG